MRNLYLALGDSVTAGYGAPEHQGFTAHIHNELRRYSLANQFVVVAQNGWAAKDVWQASFLINESTWRKTSVVTLVVGGNDLRRLLRHLYLPWGNQTLNEHMVEQRLAEYRYYLDQICGRIHHYEVPHVLLATMYNPVPNSQFAVRAIESLNRITKETANQYKFRLADVYQSFKDHEADYIEGYRSGRFEDLATPFFRPIHPNDSGHRQIAEVMRQSLTPIISPTKLVSR